MKIKSIRPFAVKGGFRYWIFVKIETDEGLVGWGDGSDWDAPETVTKAVEYLAPYLIGEDPMNIEKIWWKNTQIYKRMWGGIAWKAMSAIDTALWDLKGKALGVPVYQLLGGKIRSKLRLYWTHCGTARHLYPELLQVKPLDTMDDLREFCQVVKESGMTALKTNVMSLKGTPLFEKTQNSKVEDVTGNEISTGLISKETLKTVEMIVSTFRDELGDDMDIALDTAFNFKGKGALDLARMLEPYHMMWLETETFDPDAQKALRQATTTPIVHGESIYDLHGYLPFLQRHAQDGLMIDLAWNGLTMGKKIADLALTFDCTVSPHNCHSPLTTFVAAHFCAAVKNFSILEFDYDDVPWRDDIISDPIEIKNGYLTVPEKPGLGVELIESELKKHSI